MKKLNELAGITPEAEKELMDSTKRGVNLMKEWSETEDTIQNLPKEINDLKIVSRYNAACLLSGTQTVMITFSGLDMAIEAAYNFGKAQPKEKSKT